MEGMPQVPDVYNTNQELNGTVMSLKRELQNAKQVAHKAQSTWDKFRKERDFHEAAPQAHRAGEEQAPRRHQEAPQALARYNRPSRSSSESTS